MSSFQLQYVQVADFSSTSLRPLKPAYLPARPLGHRCSYSLPGRRGWPSSSPLHPQLKESRGGWTSALLQLLSSCQHNTKQLPPSEPPVMTPNPMLLVTPGSNLPGLPIPVILSSPEYSELHLQPTSTITPLPYPGLRSSFSMCLNLSVLKETLPQPHSSLVTYFFCPS